MTVGDKIRDTRKAKKLTQKELAKRAGIALTSLQQYEYHKRQPTISQLEKISGALEVSTSFLLDNAFDVLKTSRFKFEDWLKSCGYFLVSDEDNASMFLVDDDTNRLYEITENELMNLQKNVEIYTRFQIQEMFKTS